ncbi:glycine betaine ABC transporter substrate-binding protein [Leisingera daeponensis]|uniref:glycine betaine ABC transporter substrate-binding protein n=1 Tax=Leisingera daeponensis TaxID=405746 RepID=UPI001C978234|nr:glycine betaine ABC transporter substrate-binding protein [Leisingera daeponensis]MBY6058656.1 hypothetical protein [Leisingera daeponensis]
MNKQAILTPYSLTDFKLLELPAYEPDCETEAAWGVNPDATFDCGFAPSSIYKVAWPGMKEKWPEAYALLQQINIPLDQYENGGEKVDHGSGGMILLRAA